MPDITKGYTFSDSKADWASEKETALRLNKLVDDAKVNLVAGSNISISRGSSGITISSTGGGTGTVTNVSVVSANGVSGTVANPTTTPAITLALGAITPTSVAATGTVGGSNLSGTNTGDQTITLTSDVTGSGTGSFATTIANGVVTNAKLANVATATFKGRTTAGTGSPEDLTAAQATALLNTFNSTTKGLVGPSGGGTTSYLRADGTFTSALTPASVAASGTVTGSNLSGTNTGDQTITLTSDVTGSGTGSFATTIAAGVVTNAKLANVATATFKGRTSAGTGSPEDLTATQATALLNTFTSSLKGLAPSSGGGTANFLRADGTWANPSPVFNVRDYGAVGDGSTNDSSAFQSAINAAAAATNGGTVYVPQGNYKLSTSISISSSKSISIIGGGPQSQILCASNGFSLTSTASYVAFEVRDLCFKASVSGNTCISAVGLPSNATHSNNILKIVNVNITSNGSAYWGIGVTAQMCSNMLIDNCVFDGSALGGSILGSIGVQITSMCVNTVISNTNINYFSTAVSCLVYQEGLFIDNCAFVAVGTGVRLSTNGIRSAALLISNSHIDARGASSSAVWVSSSSAIFITGCLFISSGSDSGKANIIFDSCYEIAVTGSQLYGPTWGINLTGTTYAASIVGNNFRNAGGINIYAQSSTTQIIANGNTASDQSGSFVNLSNLDSGSNNFIGDSIGVSGTVTAVGGSTSETFIINVAKASLGKTPLGVCPVITNSTVVGATYDASNASNSKSQVVIKLFRFDGGTLSAGSYSYSLRVGA